MRVWRRWGGADGKKGRGWLLRYTHVGACTHAHATPPAADVHGQARGETQTSHLYPPRHRDSERHTVRSSDTVMHTNTEVYTGCKPGHSLQMYSGETHPCTDARADAHRVTAAQPAASTHVPRLPPSTFPHTCFPPPVLLLSVAARPCPERPPALLHLCAEAQGEFGERSTASLRLPWAPAGGLVPPCWKLSSSCLPPRPLQAPLSPSLLSPSYRPALWLWLLGCLHRPLPSAGPSPQCPQGAPSSLLGALTLRSSAETKLSEAAPCSPPFPPLSPLLTATLASAGLSPAALGAVALASAPGSLVAG